MMSNAAAWVHAANAHATQARINSLVVGISDSLLGHRKADVILTLAHLVATGALATDEEDPHSVMEAIIYLAKERVDRHVAHAAVEDLLSRVGGRVN